MTRLAATGREPEEWARATESAREVRATVAAQLAELVVEGDKMGSRGGLTLRLQRMIEAEARIETARRAQAQARQSGVSDGRAREAIAEGHAAMRAAVMEVAVEAAQWAAALDFAPSVD